MLQSAIVQLYCLIHRVHRHHLPHKTENKDNMNKDKDTFLEIE